MPLREWISERFKSYDSRIRSNHDKLQVQERELNKQGRSMVRIEEQLADQKGDLEDLKKTLNRIMWGLFGAIGVGLMFVVAVGSLVIQAA